MGAGGNSHWNRWALEQTDSWGRMGNLICPKCLYALVSLFSRAHLPPVLLCFSAHSPQRLFTLEPFCPGAIFSMCMMLASAHFLKVPICIRLVLHLSQQPICSDAHFYWCPLPLSPIPRCSFFPNAILFPYKNVRFHAVPQSLISLLLHAVPIWFYKILHGT